MQGLKYSEVHREGHLLIVTINRPEVFNALHPPANEELQEVFDRYAADPNLWVAIITGKGDRAFCTGNDLKYQAAGNKVYLPRAGMGGLTSRTDLDKPVVAAVNGFAMGGGFEIALACDLIIAAESARFALPEPRVGLAALAGGLVRLPQQIPMKQAMGMILTGRQVTAVEGRQMGFVNEVVPQAELMAAARQWVDQILECSPLSIRASKAMVHRHARLELVDREIAKEAVDEVRRLYTSEDFVEGPKAFAEKRKPVWRGR